MPSASCDICPLREIRRELASSEQAFLFSCLKHGDAAIILHEVDASLPLPVMAGSELGRASGMRRRFHRSSPDDQATLLALAGCARNIQIGVCHNTAEYEYSMADFRL